MSAERRPGTDATTFDFQIGGVPLCCGVMRRFLPLVLLVVTLSVVVTPFALAASSVGLVQSTGKDRSPAAPIAGALSTITGIAISPLLGTGLYGAYQWWSAKDSVARQALPWYAQAGFWLPALLLVGVCAAKDAFGAVIPPGWKKPLDVLETIENKATGLVAAGAVVPFTMAAMSKVLVGSAASTDPMLPTGLAMLPIGAMDLSWFLNILTIPFGVAIFLVVWMASHAINVLILLSPWGAIDAALKSARTGVLAILAMTSALNPWAGAAISVVIIIFAYFVAGWAGRLSVFGWVFCWDFITRRRRRFQPADNNNWMFAGGNLPGVPTRTYGRLVRQSTGNYEFIYQLWPWKPVKSAGVPSTGEMLAVGRGLFFSTIIENETQTLFLLPPRYRGFEDMIAQTYAMGGGVRDAGLRKAWSVFRELFGGVAGRAQVV